MPNRTVILATVAGHAAVLRFSFRAQLRLETELKRPINEIHRELGHFAEEPAWARLALHVAEIGLEGGRDRAVREKAVDQAWAEDVLDAAIEECGREGVCKRLREAMERASTVDGEALPEVKGDGPKGPTPEA